MDLNLPGICGFEAMKILRADPTTHIPVIAVSAHASKVGVELALNSGLFNYLTKPINLVDFNIALDLALSFCQGEPTLTAYKA